jgi:peptidoglycan/LPS O-acetylase OafA/YrhL
MPEGVSSYFVQNGNTAVIFFFVLSGFVMVLAYGNKKTSAKKFYFKRFSRLYPLYIIALILMIFLNYFLGRNISINEEGNNIYYMLGIQSWFYGNETVANPPAWSLSVEYFFYILFPFILVLFKNRYRIMFLLTVLIWCLTLCLFILTHDFENYTIDFYNFHPLYHISTFFIGIIAGLFWLNNKKYSKNTVKMILLLILVLFVVIPLPLFHNSHNPILSPLFALLIYFIASYEFSKKIRFYNFFNHLGSLSYGIYILHWPLNIIYCYLFSERYVLDPTIHFYGFMLFLLVISYLMLTFIENPIKKKLNSFII